jgi:hypothetical protein
MKKIIIEKEPDNKFIVEKTTKFIKQWLEKEFSIKELKEDKEAAFQECSKLVSVFAETVYLYKKEGKPYNLVKKMDKINILCSKFTKVFSDLIYNKLIETPIKAIIILTWDHVLRKFLKDAIKLSDFLGSQVAIILLFDINIEIEKTGMK